MPLERGLADLLITDLSRSAQLTVVERDRMQALADEIQLSQSDRVDAATSVRAGKLIQAGTPRERERRAGRQLADDGLARRDRAGWRGDAGRRGHQLARPTLHAREAARVPHLRAARRAADAGRAPARGAATDGQSPGVPRLQPRPDGGRTTAVSRMRRASSRTRDRSTPASARRRLATRRRRRPSSARRSRRRRSRPASAAPWRDSRSRPRRTVRRRRVPAGSTRRCATRSST